MVMPRAFTTEPTRRCSRVVITARGPASGTAHAEIDARRESAADRRALESRLCRTISGRRSCAADGPASVAAAARAASSTPTFMAGGLNANARHARFMRTNGSGTRRRPHRDRPIRREGGETYSADADQEIETYEGQTLRCPDCNGSWESVTARETAYSQAKGRLAQLGEHQLDKLGVTGSSPVPPT